MKNEFEALFLDEEIKIKTKPKINRQLKIDKEYINFFVMLNLSLLLVSLLIKLIFLCDVEVYFPEDFLK